VSRFVAEEPDARVDADLESAEKHLAAIDAHPPHVQTVEVFFGRWFAIGRAASLASYGAVVPIDGWFARNAARIARTAPHLQAAVNALDATLAKPWPPWQRIQGRCFERRSAIAFFADFATRARLSEVTGIDTAALDRRLRGMTSDEGTKEDWPRGVPQSHWWWRFALSIAAPPV
jgi:hypothetical protein